MINPYSLLLKEYISQSRMSLSEIENEMRKRGLNKNKAYLSSLQNGKMAPPSFFVTRELCDIIGGNPVRLALTGSIMEISKQDFFPINRDIKDTIATMIAVTIDINKEKLSSTFSNSFIENGVAMSEEESLRMLSYDQVKEVLNLAIQSLPLKEAFEMGIQANFYDEDLLNGRNYQSEHKNNLSLDESVYLDECLSVYRKLNLKPNN